MTTVPSQILPLPATDATVTAGLPEAGLSVRLDPSTAITQGVIGGRKFGGRIMNWILGGFGDWLAYLREANGDRLTDTPRTFTVPAALVADQAHTYAENAFDLKGPGSVFGSGNEQQICVKQNITGCVFMWDLSGVLSRDGLLTQLDIQLVGDGGWSTLPTTVPQLGLIYVGVDGTVIDPGLLVADTSANAAAFKAQHAITLVPDVPVDLDTAEFGVPARIYALLIGAANALFSPVYFLNLRAQVKAKPWA